MELNEDEKINLIIEETQKLIKDYRLEQPVRLDLNKKVTISVYEDCFLIYGKTRD